MNKNFFLGICICLAFVYDLNAQVLFPGHHNWEYVRFLKLSGDESYSGKMIYQSVNITKKSDSLKSGDIWENRLVESATTKKNFSIINPYFTFSHNTGTANGDLDGARWQGKGFNAGMSFGISGKMGKIHYTIAPTFYFAQNNDFLLVNTNISRNEFSYAFSPQIDWVQRFGQNSVAKMDLGQTDVRLILKNWTIGVGTQNMIWGPSQFNPIIMSNNAPGFPHLDFGTNGPIETKIGLIEFRNYWGILKESGFFDANNDNNERYFTGFSLGYSPNFIQGLTIGFNRVLYQYLVDYDITDTFAAYTKFFSGADELLNGRLVNDRFDQLASLVIHWVFTEVGFETYIEFARNDFSGGFSDFFLNPEHSRGFTFGFSKIGKLAKGHLKFDYEHTTLGVPREHLVRPTGSFYVHGIVNQGYTNYGQLMGAPIGPGANADNIRLTYFKPNGLVGFKVTRSRYNDDYFFDTYGGTDFRSNDVGYDLGLKYVKFYKHFDLGIDFNYTIRTNWQYIPEKIVGNVRTALSINWRIVDQHSQ